MAAIRSESSVDAHEVINVYIHQETCLGTVFEVSPEVHWRECGQRISFERWMRLVFDLAEP